LRDRELFDCIGCEHGIEGAVDDDWQLLDCNYYAIHLFTEAARKAMNLEAHWTMPRSERPTIPSHLDDAAAERLQEELNEKYPLPEEELNISVTAIEEEEEFQREVDKEEKKMGRKKTKKVEGETDEQEMEEGEEVVENDPRRPYQKIKVL
jgi:hypothetical protein